MNAQFVRFSKLIEGPVTAHLQVSVNSRWSCIDCKIGKRSRQHNTNKAKITKISVKVTPNTQCDHAAIVNCGVGVLHYLAGHARILTFYVLANAFPYTSAVIPKRHRVYSAVTIVEF